MPGVSLWLCTDADGINWVRWRGTDDGKAYVYDELELLHGFNKVTEDWMPQSIDPNLWTVTNPATNPVIVLDNTAPRVGYSVVFFDVEDAENTRLIGRLNTNRWRVVPNLLGTNHLLRKLVMEWELYINDVAHMDVTTFMGLVTNPASTRVTNELIGFGVTAAGILESVTDRGGVEEANDTFGETLEDTQNLLKIEVGAGEVLFYVNGTLVARHNTAANLPDQLMYPCWYLASAGGGADTFEYYLGPVSIRYEPT